jgi:hypothetical protein
VRIKIPGLGQQKKKIQVGKNYYLSLQQSPHVDKYFEALKRRVDMEPHFMSRIITGDETWVYGHDSQTKLHS